ncbi:MAG: methyltransferase domain-containing protein [Tenuifilum sp.]|uniref:RsmB/NOP family class I SAM-dependent RNA methyltransferase n=1 Tax=Tenuifilum sp. TaxID=2760880 RepID=UPI0030A1A634
MGSVFETAGRALGEVVYQNRNLDQVISYWIAQNKLWEPFDKYQFAVIVEETTRWWRLLNELHDSEFPKFGSHTHNIVAIYTTLTPFGFPEERKIPKHFKKKFQNKLNQLSNNRAIKESIPDWLDELGFKELGEKWPKEIHSLNHKAPIVLRTNLLKTNVQELNNFLKREGYKTKIIPNTHAILLTESANIFKSEAFKLGMFEQQDFSSQQVVPFLNVEPGMRVIDACAGNGGKTLHLASLMNNQGRIIALDTAPWKLEELKRRSRKAGVTNVETKAIETTKTIKRLQDSADRLLIDAPCSGLGVLKRNPDSKWRLTPENIDELRKTQRQILEKYWPMLKVGGCMVYATCSILPSENEEQVKWFLDQMNGRFVLEEEKHLSPSQTGFDGFYMARLKRID